jgi:hypothetical protein
MCAFCGCSSHRIKLLTIKFKNGCDLVIERHASVHIYRSAADTTSQLFDLAAISSSQAAFISNRTTRIESNRSAATLLLLCVYWRADCIYIWALVHDSGNNAWSRKVCCCLNLFGRSCTTVAIMRGFAKFAAV